MAPWETKQFPFFMTKGYQRDLRVTGFIKFLSLRSLKTSILNRNTNCEMDLDSIVSMFQYQMSIITKHFKPQMWIFWSDKQHLGLQIQRLLHKCIQTQQQDQKCSVEVPPHHPNSHHWWLPWKVLTYLSETTYQRSKKSFELKNTGRRWFLVSLHEERKTSGVRQDQRDFWTSELWNVLKSFQKSHLVANWHKYSRSFLSKITHDRCQDTFWHTVPILGNVSRARWNYAANIHASLVRS